MTRGTLWLAVRNAWHMARFDWMLCWPKSTNTWLRKAQLTHLVTTRGGSWVAGRGDVAMTSASSSTSRSPAIGKFPGDFSGEIFWRFPVTKLCIPRFWDLPDTSTGSVFQEKPYKVDFRGLQNFSGDRKIQTRFSDKPKGVGSFGTLLWLPNGTEAKGKRENTLNLY